MSLSTKIHISLNQTHSSLPKTHKTHQVVMSTQNVVNDGGHTFEYYVNNGCLLRMFWTDLTVRNNYAAVGDVVIFDATYGTNNPRRSLEKVPTTTASGKSITECTSCGRVIEERQSHPHHLLPYARSEQPTPPHDDSDPFEATGFITAFSTWSLEPNPIFARSSLAFSGHLAELESTSSSSSALANASGPDISDHAFQLFRDCCSATCLRNRSVEALATAALEISIAANVPQKEIGKYIKILGEALQLSQPINSNLISVHMPRFCTLLQLNKSAQELATHIGEVVFNKCFCAQLLENWDDLLPSNYTPAVPPEKAFPKTAISSGRSTTPNVEKIKDDGKMKGTQTAATHFWQKQPPPSAREFDKKEPQSTRQDTDQMMGEDAESNTSSPESCQQSSQTASNPSPGTWPFKHLTSMPPLPAHSSRQESAGKETKIPSSNTSSISWSFRPQTSSTPSQLNGTPLRAPQGMHDYGEIRGTGIHNGSRRNEHSSGDK
uniref:Uncharacterized protein n=1 Tax=Kalanchoe fedtschenkoi TaxID=63787 RepID=A0A7N0V1K1_KALFE